jgi:methyl halide transferase
MVETPNLTSDQPEFWATRYQNQSTPWDLGQPAPSFVSLLKQHEERFPPGKMAVVGSGYGHDAGFFGESGFEVIGFDYVPEAVAGANERYGRYARFVQADIFNLPGEYLGMFDYVLEHTCFCAIRPRQREGYVQAVYSLLQPGGTLIGLFWAHTEEGGPPYSTNRQELEHLFSSLFDIENMTIPPDSVADRQGEELLMIARRKG